MHVLKARNVHCALPEAVRYLHRVGVSRNSRNGEVLQAPWPVTTVYENPRERVMFWPQRDANPFFHFYEGLWMLGGRQDVASLVQFVQQIQEYSDDGEVFHGAYGYRWRKHFGGCNINSDQLQQIAGTLRKDPTCRRQVLQMWDVDNDLFDQIGKKDKPCNLVVTFQVNSGALDMVVFNRSNDIVWGCYGANAVHFSMLLEYMCAATQLPMGTYTQISVNWHAYTATLDKVRALEEHCGDAYERLYGMAGPPNPYQGENCVAPYTMINTDIPTWERNLQMFLDEGSNAMGYTDPFFRCVAVPILVTHQKYKNVEGPARFEAALQACSHIKATDWRYAIQQWLERRLEIHNKRT